MGQGVDFNNEGSVRQLPQGGAHFHKFQYRAISMIIDNEGLTYSDKTDITMRS